MAFGYPYNLQNGPVPTYFNTNYMPPQMAQPQMQPREQIVQPGCTAWMMDNNDPVIHVKAVDGMGTATLKSFQLMEINPQQQPAAQQVDFSQFVTRTELKDISDKLARFEAEIGGLNT